MLVPIAKIQAIPNNIILTPSDLVSATPQGIITYDYDKEEECLSFKLLGVLPIKSVSAKLENTPRTAYLGGMAIGLSVKADGLIVTELCPVETHYGKVLPDNGIDVGDIITAFYGQKIITLQDLQNALESYAHKGGAADIKVLRGGKEKVLTVYPVMERYTDIYKLGIVTKEYAEGVGTVSYIKKCGGFASLGHPIHASNDGNLIPANGGKVFDCSIVGYHKGLKGNPGELRGVFSSGVPSGAVVDNTRFGVYGKLNTLPPLTEIEIASRHNVRTGKAQIVATINDTPEWFDIEIIKLNPQNTANEKGIVIKVVDKRLLNSTGGIVQGMSGSPIVQDGKLVGAVTHVFVSDPSRGYGLYMDWMYA